MKILFPFAKRFIAGGGTQDSSLVFQKHLDQDYVVVANLVGENILSRDLISEIYDQYKILLQKFDSPNFSISIKATSLGLDLSFQEAQKNLMNLSKYSQSNYPQIRLDMEDSSYTDQTINLCKSIQNDNPGSIGITLQANLFRTENDLKDLINSGISIRLVKGAYFENEEVAFTKLKDVRERFIDYSKLLLNDNKTKHSIATHDENILKKVKSFNGIKAHRFEFLYGVRRDLQESFKQENEVGIYMPFGKDWLSYTVRRLKEFKNIKFVAKNFIRER